MVQFIEDIKQERITAVINFNSNMVQFIDVKL